MTPTSGVRCFTATDTPHDGSPDLVAWPPSLAEITAAIAAMRDATKAPELYRLCGSLDRCEVVIALTQALATRRRAVGV